MRSSLKPWLIALLACACVRAEKKPQDVAVNAGAYLLTVPAGWTVEERAMESGSFITTATPPFLGDEGNCVLAFIPSEGFTADEVRGSYVGAQKKQLEGGASTPRTLDTGFGPFAGERFHGKAPGKGAIGLAAQLAGELTTDVYCGTHGKMAVMIQISTFAEMKHPEWTLERCGSIAKSLRDAPRDAGPATAVQ